MTTRKRPAKQLACVSQLTLLSIATDEAALALLKEGIKRQEVVLQQRKEQLLADLRAGAEVEPGAYEAVVQQEVGKVSPRWKDEFLRHMKTVHGISPGITEVQVRASYEAPVHQVVVVRPVEEG